MSAAIDNDSTQQINLFGESAPAPRGISSESLQAAQDFSVFIRENNPTSASTSSKITANISDAPANLARVQQIAIVQNLVAAAVVENTASEDEVSDVEVELSDEADELISLSKQNGHPIYASESDNNDSDAE